MSANTQATASTDIISTLRAPVASDFAKMNQLITDELFSDVPLIQQIARYIVKSGGKRLRPLLVLLSAKACGYDGDEHIELATVIEFIHTATLLHDDVVDKSTQRRGQDTANEVFGNQASVLVGDFLYSRSFQLLAKRANIPVTRVLADSTNAIAEGEVLQLINSSDPDATETSYLEVIKRKTAELFAAGCQIGAIVGCADETIHQAMRLFGEKLGMAYQIIDDMLDYRADEKNFDKNLGDDLAEGKPTLPLIYTMQQSSESIRTLIKHIIEGKEDGRQHFSTIVTAIQSSQSFDRCFELAQHFMDQARHELNKLPESHCKSALHCLCDFVLSRPY